MPHQVRSYMLILLSFAMLIGVLMQSACYKDKENKTLPAKEFINDIKGEWYVYQFYKGIRGPWGETTDTVILIQNDSVIEYINFGYGVYDHKYSYALNDPALCTIPEIVNHMQHWSISVVGSDSLDLILETTDLFSKNIDNWQISYSDLPALYGSIPTSYAVTMKIIKGDTTCWLNDFFLLNHNSDTVMSFFIKDHFNEGHYWFRPLSEP